MQAAPRAVAATLRFVSIALAGACLALTCASGAGAASEAPQGTSAGTPVAISAELSVRAGRTQLTFVLSQPVSAKSFLLERPDRAIIDLDAVNFQLPPDAGRTPTGVVRSFRCGLAAPGRSRIVVDLAAPAVLARVESVKGAVPGVNLLSLEFVRTDREAFHRAASRTAENGEVTTGSVATAVAPDRRPVIVVDAGHGGVDPGAMSATGVFEKDIVLAFAESLRDRLVATGRYQVVMTRDSDVFIPLDERVRRARAAGAALFLSIHADTISSPSVSGTTLYTGAERASDVESATLAERENAADAAGGGSSGGQADDLVDILQDLTSRETRSFSHLFAGHLLNTLRGVTHFTVHPRREAGFRVLRSGDVPAVLIELGYLSNAKDVGMMVSEHWRERTTDAMAAAVARFFETRMAGGAPVSP